MTRQELQTAITKLENLIATLRPSRILQLNMLLQDLQEFDADYQALSNIYRCAWETAVLTRLEKIGPIPYRARNEFSALQAYWNTVARRRVIRIRFGQMRVGPNFQGAMNVHQEDIVGFPADEVVGKSIASLATSLRAGDVLPDSIPVHIFYSAQHDAWITANNRSFTAFCLAGIQPLRIKPRAATQDEANRLGDVEGAGDMSDFTGAVAAQLNVRPRTLPSLEMPVTNGPNTWSVVNVARVPASFHWP